MRGFRVFIFLVILATIAVVAYYQFEQEIDDFISGGNSSSKKTIANVNGNSSKTTGGFFQKISALLGGTKAWNDYVNSKNIGTKDDKGLIDAITAWINGKGGNTGGNSGNSGSGGGSNRGGGGVIGNGNTSIFEFNQPSNGQSLPSSAQGNGYIRCHLFSHCRVATPVQDTPQGAYASCEVWLYNANTGQLVWHLKDNVGGFHPNFFNPSERGSKPSGYYGWIDNWANSFQPFPPFNSASDRGNNHFSQFNKYVVEGQYRFVYLNNSNTKHTVTAGFIRADNGTGQLNEVFAPSPMPYERMINITPNNDPDDDFKFNSNNYVL